MKKEKQGSDLRPYKIYSATTTRNAPVVQALSQRHALEQHGGRHRQVLKVVLLDVEGKEVDYWVADKGEWLV